MEEVIELKPKIEAGRKKLKKVFIDEKEMVYLDGELFDTVTSYRIENSCSTLEPAKLTLTMYVDVDGVGLESKEKKTERLVRELKGKTNPGHLKGRSNFSLSLHIKVTDGFSYEKIRKSIQAHVRNIAEELLSVGEKEWQTEKK